MKKGLLEFAGAVSVAFAALSATGCGAGDMSEFDGAAADDAIMSEDEALADDGLELGTTEQGLMSCANPDGTNSVMAAFAVAVAQELKRWQAGKDFVQFNTSGYSESSPGMQQAIKLTSGYDSKGQPVGKTRCADGKCAKVQAILDMQYDQANNKVFLQSSSGSVLLSPAALRSRMVAKLSEQKTCDAWPKDGDLSKCPVEEHSLTFLSAAKGSCDTNFYFQAKKADGTTLRYPGQLKNKLWFADQTNPYISFADLGGGQVSIDPTYGLNEDGTTSSGTCTAACTKITTTNVAGQCCTCNGVNKTFVRSAWSTSTYLCQ